MMSLRNTCLLLAQNKFSAQIFSLYIKTVTSDRLKTMKKKLLVHQRQKQKVPGWRRLVSFFGKKERLQVFKYQKDRNLKVEIEGNEKSLYPTDKIHMNGRLEGDKKLNQRKRRPAICAVKEEKTRYNGNSLSELRNDLIIRYVLINSGLI